MTSHRVTEFTAAAYLEVGVDGRGATTFSKSGVQFLGLGYCTEQNADAIPSFMDCSMLRNGSHALHQKSWGRPSKFWGVRTLQPPSSCALGWWTAEPRIGVAVVSGVISLILLTVILSYTGKTKMTKKWTTLSIRRSFCRHTAID